MHYRRGSWVSGHHRNGSWIEGHYRSGTEVDRNAFEYKISSESKCFLTHCPKCNCDVFFVRHNGGSVWLDPPLGWPWYKHECFNKEEISSSSFESALVTPELKKKLIDGTGLEIGVVQITWVEPNKNFTDIVLDVGEATTKEIRVKNNAEFLLGKLCVINARSDEIWPFYEPDYLFVLYDPDKHKYVIPEPIVKLNKKLVKEKIKQLRIHRKQHEKR